MDSQQDDEHPHWYVMRDLKRPNARQPAYKQLSDSGMEVFTPMMSRIMTRNGRRVCENVPVLQDLLFVHALRRAVDRVIAKTPTLQYRFAKGCGYRNPMTVPDADMERFIHAVSVSDNLKYYLPGEVTADMCGREVRIIGGSLDGCTGKLLRVRGSRTKRLLIEMAGLFFVGVEVSPEYVQLI